MPMNVTVVPSITGKINHVPLKEEDVQFLKGKFAEGKLADSLPCHANIEMRIGNDYYFELLEPRNMDVSGGLSMFHSKLGWILGGRVKQPSVMHSESSLLVSTVGSVPDVIKPTTHTLTSIDPSLTAKPSLDRFWNLESLGITKLPSQNDECAFENFF